MNFVHFFSYPFLREGEFVELVSDGGVEEFIEHTDDAACTLCIGEDVAGVLVCDKDFFNPDEVEVSGVIAVEKFDACENVWIDFFDEKSGKNCPCIAVLVRAWFAFVSEEDGFGSIGDASTVEDIHAGIVPFDDVEHGRGDAFGIEQRFGFIVGKLRDEDNLFAFVFFAALEDFDEEVGGSVPTADDDVLFEFFEIHVSRLHLRFEFVDHDRSDNPRQYGESDDACDDDEERDKSAADRLCGASGERFTADKRKNTPPECICKRFDFDVVGFDQVKRNPSCNDKGEKDGKDPEVLENAVLQPRLDGGEPSVEQFSDAKHA